MKKRLSKLALLAVAAAFVLVGFPACGDDDDGEDPPAVLTDIAVEAQPTKTTYKINDNFDPAGLVIKAVYSDGTSENITYREDNKAAFAFTGFDSSKPSESVTVTVTYKEKTTTFNVTVAANEPDSNKTITGISVETPPTKTAYTVGDDTLDPSGLVITVTYDDNTTDPIAYSEANKNDFTFDFDFSTASESVTVTVTYKEKTTTFNVSVAANKPDPEKTIASIAVKTNPTKTAYTVGDTTIDPSGLVITVTYSDNTTDPIAYSEANKDDFKFTGFDASKANESVTVTVMYKEKATTFTVSVKEKEPAPAPEKTLSSITVQKKPTKVAYTVGEDLDPAGLVITATYSDGSIEDIAYNTTDFSLTGFDASAANESVTVTVTYKGKETTFTVSVAEAEKSLFETLSAQDNNILAEDFTAFTVSPFGEGFGKVGVYGADGVTVSDGVISTGATGTNRKIHVDFGPVKETVEGCVTLTVGGGKNAQTGKNLLTFYNGDTAFLTLKTGTGDNTVGGIAGTYEIYYKFDLTAKTVSLKVNDTDVLTDSALSVDSVSGYMIESHNGGKGTVTAGNIAVCATKADLGTYKAQVKAWLETLVTNSYSEKNGYSTNKAAVAQAKNNGDSAIDAAGNIEAVLAAYGDAKTALSQVKNDVTQAKEDACKALDDYFPTDKTAESYTEDQLKAVTEAKEAGKTAINAASSVEAVNTALAEAKAKIDALPDDSATAHTVTVITNDDTTLGTVTTYTNVADVLDKIKELITDPKQVIEDSKFYSDQACATEYTTTETLTGDVTVYVKLVEKKTMTYVLDASTASFTTTKDTKDQPTEGYAEIDGMKFEIIGNKNKALPATEKDKKCVNLGGTLKTSGNYIKFTTTQTASVVVEFFAGSDGRSVKIMHATDTTLTKTGKETTTKDGALQTTAFTTSFPAGTYYLGSSNSGIYISKVTVTTE